MSGFSFNPFLAFCGILQLLLSHSLDSGYDGISKCALAGIPVLSASQQSGFPTGGAPAYYYDFDMFTLTPLEPVSNPSGFPYIEYREDSGAIEILAHLTPSFRKDIEIKKGEGAAWLRTCFNDPFNKRVSYCEDYYILDNGVLQIAFDYTPAHSKWHYHLSEGLFFSKADSFSYVFDRRNCLNYNWEEIYREAAQSEKKGCVIYKKNEVATIYSSDTLEVRRINKLARATRPSFFWHLLVNQTVEKAYVK